MLRRIHGVLLHAHRSERLSARHDHRGLVEGRRLGPLRRRGPLLHRLQHDVRTLSVRRRRHLLRGVRGVRVRMRGRQLQQPQDGLHPLPLRPVQPARRLRRADRLPGRELCRPVDLRSGVRHQLPDRRGHPLPRPSVPERAHRIASTTSPTSGARSASRAGRSPTRTSPPRDPGVPRHRLRAPRCRRAPPAATSRPPTRRRPRTRATTPPSEPPPGSTWCASGASTAAPDATSCWASRRSRSRVRSAVSS